MPKAMGLAAELSSYGACAGARQWARRFRNESQAWKACHKPDWMLWAVARRIRYTKTGSWQHKRFVSCLCALAELTVRPNRLIGVRTILKAVRSWTTGDLDRSWCLLRQTGAAVDARLDELNTGRGPQAAIVAVRRLVNAVYTGPNSTEHLIASGVIDALDHGDLLRRAALREKLCGVIRTYYPQRPPLAVKAAGRNEKPARCAARSV